METVEGVLLLDVEAETVFAGTELPELQPPKVGLPRVVAAAAAGSTVVAVIDRRPPLMVSHDGGRTWREAGGGLPAGFGVAVAAGQPDRMLYAGRNRLYLSEDGGTFWRRLAPELPDVLRLAFLEET
ncbi:MAG: WD40/YVTN/BNR-like repeat-containing protein [Gaiellaceae bacterium]